MRAVRIGPVIGLISQLALLAALAGTVGVGRSGWVVGIACGLILNAVLAGGLARYGADRLGPADRVTLTRATLAGGVAALTADSFGRPTSVTMLVALTVVALVLDAVDGWVARRTHTLSLLGAHFDAEVDAFLILVLSVYVARSIGGWILAIGAARYVFLAAGWLLPWMRRTLPPRYWRKVVAATQGVTLAFAAADVLPRFVTNAALAVALALLSESFGRDVGWLWRRRPRQPTTVDGRSRNDREKVPASQRSRVRTAAGWAITVLASLLVWFALVAPNELPRLSPRAFVRIPLEGLLAVAFVLAVPPRVWRKVAALVGVALGVLSIMKILDIGFFAAFERPFDPVVDWVYFGSGVALLSDAVGRPEAIALVVAAGVLGVAIVISMPLAVLRLTRLVARQRTTSVRALTALGAIWILCAVFGVQIVRGTPIASIGAAGFVYGKGSQVRASMQDEARFAKVAAVDRFRNRPADDLLTGLRGKDVIVAFVESYGRVAVEGSAFSPQVDAALNAGTSRLRAAGYSCRSAFLTSPTFGGISWLAHSTLQSGLWIDSQHRYDDVVASDRFTLSDGFKRAGWRTVGDVPANDRNWPQARSFYHYDKLYDRRNVGYVGPKFSYAPMPDQYVLSSFQRLELAKPNRAPIMAEIDLVSSHTPWAPLPRLVDWSKVGDGSVFDNMPAQGQSPGVVWRDPDQVRTAYGQSIAYSLNTLISFVQTYGDDDLVLIVLGDHQPATIVSGRGAGHDVPITIIAHDPAVIDRISAWGWQDGMRPGPNARVWPMDAFRDRFLAAYGPQVDFDDANERE
ncbi:MAG: CDP-alcohol phosphatidyltransferase family protein [Actinomycetota bacterium]|nr:CDP-alcohol phosphatidyltransferase family protein [Actinomycetota bacterium]